MGRAEVDLNIEPCDQKALTSTLESNASGFTGMSCISEEGNEALQGLLYDNDRTTLHVELEVCDETVT